MQKFQPLQLQHLLLDKLKHLLWNKRYLTQNQQQSKLCQIHKVRLKTPLFLKHQLQRKAISLLRSRKIQAGLVWKTKNRKVLAQKEYKQGEVLTFNGNDYALIIGAAG